MAPVGSWHILRRREMIILVRRFYISASCASHASWLTLMLCSFPSFTATPSTWTNRILTHWYCNYSPYHFHLRWQHFSNWLMLILIKGMFSCFVFLMKRGKKLLLKEPISPLFAYTHGRPGLTERKRIFVTLHEQKATCVTKSDALHVQVNSYIKFLTHIAKYVLMKMLFNPFYSYAKIVIVCSRHLFSGGEQEKKSSCIYDKLIYTDSKQSKKRHWEIFKLFQSSELNGQISLKLKCFAWVAITLCRCSRQGYKRITSGMIWIFFIHLTP